MAPPAALVEPLDRSTERRANAPEAGSPAAKRRKIVLHGADGGTRAKVAEQLDSGIPRHPYGVRPLGNLYDASEPNIRKRAGYLAALPDELLASLLEYLQGRDLVQLGTTCKALYAFTRMEELWKLLFLDAPPADFRWQGTWRSTYLGIGRERQTSPISCRGLYSDVLYRPFQCVHTHLEPFFTNIPNANAITRLDNLSADDFNAKWADKPFILTEPVKKWRVYQQWDDDYLLQHYAQVSFRAEAVDWPLEKYVEYMRDSSDESPLYLFDCYFAEKMQLSVGATTTDDADKTSAYTPPATFYPDLFHTLGPQRPHHRWLIVGPTRSGSTFHKDPNATSAWNAVLRGSKYWIMFPSVSPSGHPLPPPPGVFVSADQSEVTSPLSIAEWLLAFHREARSTPGCVEGICRAGEILHVPSGWFHLVLNLQDSVALTQNFVPRAHLGNVLAFLRDRPEQVTGFAKAIADPFALFVEKLRLADPDALEAGLAEMERLAREQQQQQRQQQKSRWEEVIEGAESGFSFGFAGDSEDFDEDVEE